MASPYEVTYDDMVKELKEELRMRDYVYKKRVELGTLSPEEAQRKKDVMRQVLNIIEFCQREDMADKGQLQLDL